jgi:hypothetical protein
VGDTVALLAGRAPKLPAALAAAKKVGHEFVIIDGTLITVDRLGLTGRSTRVSTAATA